MYFGTTLHPGVIKVMFLRLNFFTTNGLICFWTIKSENDEPHDSIDSEFAVDDKVWVKPPAAHCTTFWNPGTSTGINSKYYIEIDGVPWHLRDVTRRWADDISRKRKLCYGSSAGEWCSVWRIMKGIIFAPRRSNCEKHLPINIALGTVLP